MGFDAYDVLALSRSATSSDVSRAYRRLALKYHPDKDASPQAAEKFLEVAKAYDILHERTTRQGHTREPRTHARTHARDSGARCANQHTTTTGV